MSFAAVAPSCKPPETAKRDMVRDARRACDRGDGSACFHAGAITAEEPGGAARAEKTFEQGCALGDRPSCDAVWGTNGASREAALGAGCNAGDLLSCARVADLFAQDPKKVAQSKALREQTCRMAAVLKTSTRARDLEAAAQACSGLADMYTRGEGASIDTVLATKLDVLATTLRTEALVRWDNEEPAKPRAGGKKGAAASEADRVDRVNAASKAARAAFVALLEQSLKAPVSDVAAPAAIDATPTSPVLWPSPGAAATPSGKCAKCVASCGDMKTCAGTDDFVGGRCGSLRCADKGPCPAFDSCVAECTAKADACTKACGECAADPAAAAAASAGDDASRCRQNGDRISCAVAGGALEKTDPAAAIELYAAGCAKKQDACVNLVVYAESLFRRREGPRAAQVLDKACELKYGVACTRLGIELEEGERGVAQDLAKAARLFDKGCEAGIVRACVGLAAMIDDGRGTPKNANRAKTVRAKIEALDKAVPKPAPAPAGGSDEEACRKTKDAAVCAAAGTAMEDVDAVKAEELFRIGCSANKATCGLWTFAVERFKKDDPGRGMRILEQGCQEGSVLACLVLTDVSRFGYRSVPRSDAKALEASQRACELGDPHGCRAMAARMRAGLGVPKSAQRADEAREKAFKADEAVEKTEHEAYEKWLVRAATERAREPYVQELERRRADLRTVLDRARGHKPTDAATSEKSSPSGDQVDASMLREGAIRRMAKALFLSAAAAK